VMFDISISNELEIDIQLNQKYQDHFNEIYSFLLLKLFVIKRKLYKEESVTLSSIVSMV
jgi:hypothetical protein